jgi:hypothetical protein
MIAIRTDVGQGFISSQKVERKNCPELAYRAMSDRYSAKKFAWPSTGSSRLFRSPDGHICKR